MDSKAHWERVYRSSSPTALSWYQSEARLSLDLIRRVAPRLETPVIDVGGGASTLVDGLLEAGYRDVTVLDVAGTALDLAQARLGPLAPQVSWLETDVRWADLPPAAYGLWHDRAVFHFLTHADDRARYVAQMLRAVRPGGHIVIAAFDERGPDRCSGLNVMRHSQESLQAEFGDRLVAVDSAREDHRTPAGTSQSFRYSVWRVNDAAGARRISAPGRAATAR